MRETVDRTGKDVINHPDFGIGKIGGKENTSKGERKRERKKER